MHNIVFMFTLIGASSQTSETRHKRRVARGGVSCDFSHRSSFIKLLNAQRLVITQGFLAIES